MLRHLRHQVPGEAQRAFGGTHRARNPRYSACPRDRSDLGRPAVRGSVMPVDFALWDEELYDFIERDLDGDDPIFDWLGWLD